MASTYSTNLRTELIGTGDQAGTWGGTTNTTLGSIIEQAIAGVSGGPYLGGTYPVVNFPTDADITLTANNGSVDQSRSAVLVITSTGSLTATRNVIAPASASKVYIVKNSTTGGQSIQIKYATGTGVTIANGVTRSVYGDGSNFYVSENFVENATTATTATNATNATNVVSGGTIASSVTATTQTVGDNTTKVATTAFVQANATTLSTVYPIGSIYTSTVSTNPNTLFGFGTWAAFGAGRVMIGNGGGFTAGATGGSADAVVVSHTHTATVTDPGHTHSYTAAASVPYNGSDGGGLATTSGAITSSATTGISVSNSTAGVSGTNANLQPYIVVYMWNRTA
jgi:hypothetical protein